MYAELCFGGEKVANQGERRREARRELALIVYGSVLGLLTGVIGNLWSSYYVKMLETLGYTDWILIGILSSLLFVIVIALMSFWAVRQIRQTQ